MLHHLIDKCSSIHFTINSDIIDVLICDMFFRPDDHGGITQIATKNLFHKFEDGYRIIILNLMQFRLVIAHIGRGLSFRQVVGIINDIKEITDI